MDSSGKPSLDAYFDAWGYYFNAARTGEAANPIEQELAKFALEVVSVEWSDDLQREAMSIVDQASAFSETVAGLRESPVGKLLSDEAFAQFIERSSGLEKPDDGRVAKARVYLTGDLHVLSSWFAGDAETPVIEPVSEPETPTEEPGEAEDTKEVLPDLQPVKVYGKDMVMAVGDRLVPLRRTGLTINTFTEAFENLVIAARLESLKFLWAQRGSEANFSAAQLRDHFFNETDLTQFDPKHIEILKEKNWRQFISEFIREDLAANMPVSGIEAVKLFPNKPAHHYRVNKDAEDIEFIDGISGRHNLDFPFVLPNGKLVGGLAGKVGQILREYTNKENPLTADVIREILVRYFPDDEMAYKASIPTTISNLIISANQMFEHEADPNHGLSIGRVRVEGNYTAYWLIDANLEAVAADQVGEPAVLPETGAPEKSEEEALFDKVKFMLNTLTAPDSAKDVEMITLILEGYFEQIDSPEAQVLLALSEYPHYESIITPIFVRVSDRNAAKTLPSSGRPRPQVRRVTSATTPSELTTQEIFVDMLAEHDNVAALITMIRQIPEGNARLLYNWVGNFRTVSQNGRFTISKNSQLAAIKAGLISAEKKPQNNQIPITRDDFVKLVLYCTLENLKDRQFISNLSKDAAKAIEKVFDRLVAAADSETE